MVRHDYELIARVIKGRINNTKDLWHFEHWTEREIEACVDVLADLANFMCSELAAENKAFDRELFLKNCGLGK